MNLNLRVANVYADVARGHDKPKTSFPHFDIQNILHVIDLTVFPPPLVCNADDKMKATAEIYSHLRGGRTLSHLIPTSVFRI